jgi:hypothetical protein
VKQEAAMKCEGEGNDDDARRRLGKPLIKQNDHVKHGEWIKAAWTSSNLT